MICARHLRKDRPEICFKISIYGRAASFIGDFIMSVIGL